mmetsp:Transcript_10525/g.24389  ORF Transcript_10525/g.24389 Transcript_10525/m.24389 type:complete len:89 (+) Transcript_10525:319-585(+)
MRAAGCMITDGHRMLNGPDVCKHVVFLYLEYMAPWPSRPRGICERDGFEGRTLGLAAPLENERVGEYESQGDGIGEGEGEGKSESEVF